MKEATRKIVTEGVFLSACLPACLLLLLLLLPSCGPC